MAARAPNGEAAAAAEGVRLLGGKLSPFTLRARMALALRGVEYELVEEQFHPRKSDRLLAANPVYGKIPVLLLPDGRAICESAVIVQYVDEAWGAAGGGILPVDPYERAMHRFWTVYIDDKFWPALDAISLAPTPEARAAAATNARAALKLLEEAFTARSDGGAFFSGRGAASPGLLDVALGCFLPALWACERLNGLSLLDASTTPLLCGWSERFAATAAARAVMPETEEVVAFTRFLQTKFGVAAISK
ncbi:probable glutathione S-transferase BZ2 [Oryza brachyantha]|uniref:probable glutathione S-transferase BZ2 n=1 Tax=Oryza brachyantha TaxID=4533 RepID=UPI001ADA5254|nr:probable glutathione S-transferase BZ2 [Oryza brachyantha]